MNALDSLFARLGCSSVRSKLVLRNQFPNNVVEDSGTGRKKFLFETDRDHPFPAPDSEAFKTVEDDYLEHLIAPNKPPIFMRVWLAKALDAFRSSFGTEAKFLSTGCCIEIELMTVHISQIATEACFKLPTFSQAKGKLD